MENSWIAFFPLLTLLSHWPCACSWSLSFFLFFFLFPAFFSFVCLQQYYLKINKKNSLMVTEPVQVHRPALWGEEQAAVYPYAFSSVAFFRPLILFFINLICAVGYFQWVVIIYLLFWRSIFSFSCVSRTCAQVSANFGGLDAEIQDFRCQGSCYYYNYATIIVPAAPISWILGAHLTSGCTINSLAVLNWEFLSI